MATTIGQKFVVQAIEDGSTITATLVSNQSLAQVYMNNQPVPDWEAIASESSTGYQNCPCIYPFVYDGGTLQGSSQMNETKWFYNDTELTWNNSTHLNTNANFAGKFRKGTTSVGTSLSVECIYIVGNLVSGENYDNDTISFEAKVMKSTYSLPFKCAVNVNLSKSDGQGSYGWIVFSKNNLSSETDSLTATSHYYTGGGEAQASAYTVKWYINGEIMSSTAKTVTIYGSDITDAALLSCEFYENGVLQYTAYGYIDDTNDTIMAYQAYLIYTGSTVPTNMDANNTNDCRLHKDQNVIFAFWVAERGNITARDTGWSYGTPTLYGSGSATISKSFVSRTINVQGSSFAGTPTLTFTFNEIVQAGGTVTGYITATKSITT